MLTVKKLSHNLSLAIAELYTVHKISLNKNFKALPNY